MNADINKISKGLIEFWGYEVNTPEYESLFWAWEDMNEYVSRYPDIAWKVIIRVLELTESEHIIDCLGAGFLEHLMCEHDQVTLNLITSELPDNSKLALCMSTVRLRVSDTKLYKRFYGLINIEPPYGDEP